MVTESLRSVNSLAWVDCEHFEKQILKKGSRRVFRRDELVESSESGEFVKRVRGEMGEEVLFERVGEHTVRY